MVLEESRDAVQALHVDATVVIASSVDGYVCTYDLHVGRTICRRGHALGAILDSHVRLFDATTGKSLNAFTGMHIRPTDVTPVLGTKKRAPCGDGIGRVWAWDLLGVGGDGVLALDQATGVVRRRQFCSRILHPSQGPEKGDHMSGTSSERQTFSTGDHDYHPAPEARGGEVLDAECGDAGCEVDGNGWSIDIPDAQRWGFQDSAYPSAERQQGDSL
ncbi:hypothetical protein HD554DRAFT_2078301 [Boletus coccyginus]|nr:hypothetical protein HD554DRAFT_2078301 [Boletus coccyginus]